MQLQYYQLPLQAAAIMSRQEHAKCSLRHSVAQQLHLLITTAFGEVPAEESFGCNIWDHDFDNLTSSSKLKEMIRQSLLMAIQLHEKRLINIQIEVQVRQEEMMAGPRSRQVKKRMDISVLGVVHITNEPFHYKDSFFIGPLSY
jgi:phage baseplate assembly protein W